MSRRLLLLSGLSIFSVVLNHVAGWEEAVMLWWKDGVLTPVFHYDQLDPVPYYIMLTMRQLTLFAVPAFVFISAFFITYAARGNQSVLGRRMVEKRIFALLVPYTLWSVIISVGDFLVGVRYSPVEYLQRFITGEVASGYYYVPLLCQLYLISPLVVSLAKTRWRQLLFVSGLIQFGSISAYYLGIFQVPITGKLLVSELTPPWLLFKWVLFFAFGIICGLHVEELKQWLERFKWVLLASVLVLGFASIAEAEILFRITRKMFLGSPFFFFPSLYSFSFILCFLAFKDISIPFSNFLCLLGSRVFAVYLLHSKTLEITVTSISYFAPWIIANFQLFQPLLLVFGVAMPLLLTQVVSKSPLRKVYRYLFG